MRMVIKMPMEKTCEHCGETQWISAPYYQKRKHCMYCHKMMVIDNEAPEKNSVYVPVDGDYIEKSVTVIGVFYMVRRNGKIIIDDMHGNTFRSLKRKGILKFEELKKETTLSTVEIYRVVIK